MKKLIFCFLFCLCSWQVLLAQPHAVFLPEKTEGCSPLTINFVNLSANTAVYKWSFGDGETAFNVSAPRHTYYNENGTDTLEFVVELIAYDSLLRTDTARQVIKVFPSGWAKFDVTPTVLVYPQTTVYIQNQTPNGYDYYHWDFGDGTTDYQQQPPSHTYENYGTFDIKLAVKNKACIDTAKKTVIVRPPLPIAVFDSASEGCIPFTMHFTNNTLYADSFVWEFWYDDEKTLRYVSSNQHAKYTFNEAGQWVVKLKAIGLGGTDYVQDTVIVHEVPEADFFFSPTEIMIPDDVVRFYNTSTDAQYFKWNFGDDSSSVDISPVHIYQKAGDYVVSLIAYSEAGCIDTLTAEQYVSVLEAGEIIFPTAFTPNVDGNGYSIDPRKNNDIFHPVHRGVAEYHLIITNRWGQQMFESNDANYGWNGYFDNKLCPMDLYFWKASGKFKNGEIFEQYGNVLLVR